MIRDKEDKLKELKKGMDDMRNTSKSGSFGAHDYFELRKQLKKLEQELQVQSAVSKEHANPSINEGEGSEPQLDLENLSKINPDLETIRKQNEELTKLRTEAGEGHNFGSKLKTRVKELEAELKES